MSLGVKRERVYTQSVEKPVWVRPLGSKLNGFTNSFSGSGEEVFYTSSYPLSGTGQDRIDALRHLLAYHAEGCVVYAKYGKYSNNVHAVVLTRYDAESGEFFVIDPVNCLTEKRLSESKTRLYLENGSSVESMLANTIKVWYISAYDIR